MKQSNRQGNEGRGATDVGLPREPHLIRESRGETGGVTAGVPIPGSEAPANAGSVPAAAGRDVRSETDKGSATPERESQDQAEASPGERQRDLLGQWRAVMWRNFTIVAVFSVAVNVLMLTIPIYLFQLSDRVLTSRSLDTLMMLTLLAVAFLVVLSALDILRRQVLVRTSTALETILGGPLLAGLVGAAPSTGGGSVSALRSLHQVRGFISGPVMLMLFDAPLAPLYFAAVFLVHPDLGFIVVGSGMVLFAIAILNQRMTAAPLATASGHAAKADAHAEALARNSQVINAMGMLNEGIAHWGREQASALTTQTGAMDRNNWISGASKLCRLLTQIGLLGWGGYLALHGELTGGVMIAASIIGGKALQPVEGMIEGWRSLVQARASYHRILAMIQSITSERPKLLLPKPRGHLIVDRILYIPPGSKDPILNGVGFELVPGESLAIVGPSGSGKSTLARIIVGCLYPTAGRVRLDSTELRNWDRRQFGEYTGYVPQEVELFPGTIKANVCRMRDDLPDAKIYEAAHLTGVHEMITHLPAGYETNLDNNGAPLSGGQKQRIALARAFFGDPAIVVMDEPNANLDAEGEQALADTLRRAKERGITIVAITQRPSLLNSVDKILILRAGRAEAFGPPAEVLHRVVRPTEPVRATASRAVPPPLPAPAAPPPLPAS